MSKKTVKTPKAPSKVYYTMEKINMQAYKLLKVTVDEDGFATEEMLHRNSPQIVYAKLLVMIKNQGFTGESNGSP